MPLNSIGPNCYFLISHHHFTKTVSEMISFVKNKWTKSFDKFLNSLAKKYSDSEYLTSSRISAFICNAIFPRSLDHPFIAADMVSSSRHLWIPICIAGFDMVMVRAVLCGTVRPPVDAGHRIGFPFLPSHRCIHHGPLA